MVLFGGMLGWVWSNHIEPWASIPGALEQIVSGARKRVTEQIFQVNSPVPQESNDKNMKLL